MLNMRNPMFTLLVEWYPIMLCVDPTAFFPPARHFLVDGIS